MKIKAGERQAGIEPSSIVLCRALAVCAPASFAHVVLKAGAASFDVLAAVARGAELAVSVSIAVLVLNVYLFAGEVARAAHGVAFPVGETVLHALSASLRARRALSILAILLIALLDEELPELAGAAVGVAVAWEGRARMRAASDNLDFPKPQEGRGAREGRITPPRPMPLRRLWHTTGQGVVPGGEAVGTTSLLCATTRRREGGDLFRCRAARRPLGRGSGMKINRSACKSTEGLGDASRREAGRERERGGEDRAR